MAKGINKVIIVGNVGQDPYIRATPAGTTVATVSVATTEYRKDKSTGEGSEHTEWHRITFYAKLAEVVRDYLKKGAKVYVEGKLQTRKWKDKETGADRFATDIIANEMQMLDSKDGAKSSSKYSSESPTIDFDDDIPF